MKRYLSFRCLLVGVPVLAAVCLALSLPLPAVESSGVVGFALDNGDVNGDLARDVSDPIYLLAHLFLGGPEAAPLAHCGAQAPLVRNGDANGDGNLDVSDPIRLLGWLFDSAPAPLHPCGDGAGTARNPNPRVIPLHARPYGASYGEWTGRWWQWAGSVPAAVNPVTDTTGEHCDEGQSGSVWFLAGTFGGGVERACTVPPGKALFVPMLNFSADNFVCVDPDGTLSFDELAALAAGFMDLAANLALEVDGVALADVASYRAASPEPYDVVLPEDDVFAAVCPDSYPRVIPSIGEGYYVMLAPLSAGEHTVHLHGEVPDFGFTTDAVYHLTVGN
jgi:hypothetical protein